jgi:hypothetical protein
MNSTTTTITNSPGAKQPKKKGLFRRLFTVSHSSLRQARANLDILAHSSSTSANPGTLAHKVSKKKQYCLQKKILFRLHMVVYARDCLITRAFI